MKSGFTTYHPVVNFVYFLFVLSFSMLLMHPICLCISLVTSLIYFAILKGNEAAKHFVIFLLPMVIFAALINPAFNHEGVTILSYLPSGNPLTLESIIYGMAAAILLATIICWFSCFQMVMTSDKFIYLFGKIIPALSLILSMILRFIPKFREQISVVIIGQKCLGNDISTGGIFSRAKCGLTILSSMITWSLENAIETADSMKCRGYGLSGRTAFSIYTWEKRDTKALVFVIFLGLCVGFGIAFDGFYFRYFPSIKGGEVSILTGVLSVFYLLLCAIPIYIERREAKAWQITKSKI